MEVRHGGIASRRFRRNPAARFGEGDQGWPAGAASFSSGGDLRRCNAHRGGEDWRCWASDHPGLGVAIQHAGAGRPFERPGQPSKLRDVQRQAIARMIESGPIPAVHGVVRWRLIDLAQWIFEEFRISIAKQTLSRELRAMGYRKLSARPRHHAQVAGVIEDFKKTSPRAWMPSRARRRSTATR